MRNGFRTWSWLSFADPDKPEGEQHLGCLIGMGTGEDVLWAANQASLNPGGEVVAWTFTTDDLPPEDPIWRLPVMVLLSEQDLLAAGIAVRKGAR